MKKRHTVKSEMFSWGLNFRCLRNGLGFFGLLACRGGRKLARWNSLRTSFLHAHRQQDTRHEGLVKLCQQFILCLGQGVPTWGMGNIRMASRIYYCGDVCIPLISHMMYERFLYFLAWIAKRTLTLHRWCW